MLIIPDTMISYKNNIPIGTEFFDGKIGRYVNFDVTDILQMIGRAGMNVYIYIIYMYVVFSSIK